MQASSELAGSRFAWPSDHRELPMLAACGHVITSCFHWHGRLRMRAVITFHQRSVMAAS
jgi:hypothetical protein